MQRRVGILATVLLSTSVLYAEATPPLGPPTPGATVPASPAGGAATTVTPTPVTPTPPPGAAPLTPATPLTGGETISLLEAVTRALSNNPDIGVAREAIRRAAGQHQTANAAFYPAITAGYSEIWQQQQTRSLGAGVPPTVVTPGLTGQASLSTSWNIFSGGALRANQAIARIGGVAAQHRLEATVNDVISRTVHAYLQLLQAQELKGVADRAVDLSREQLRVASLSYDAGAVPRVNVLRAQAALQNAIEQQLSAGNNIALAIASLNLVMGRSQLQPLSVVPVPRQLAEPPDLLTSLQQAVVQRPELRAQQKAIDIDREAVRAARSGYWPQVNVTGTLTHNTAVGTFGSENGFQVIGALRLNVWDWGATSGRVKSASADVQADRHRLEQAMQGIELDVRRAVLNISDARLRVDAAQAEATASDQALSIEQLRYTSGEGTYLELLDARRTLTQAQANLVNAYYGNALAEADWLAATGGFVAGGQLALPHGERAPLPKTYQDRGKEFGDLLAQYGLDRKTGKPVAPPATPAAPTEAPAPPPPAGTGQPTASAPTNGAAGTTPNNGGK